MHPKTAATLLRAAAACAGVSALLLLASASGGPRHNPPSADPSPSVALLSASVPLDRALAEVTPVPSPTPTPAPTPAPPPREPAPPPPEPPPAPEPQPHSPAPPRPAPPQPTPTLPSYPDPATADALLTLTNQLRAAHGLPPLGANPALTASAAAYAQVLALNDWFSHTGPDGSTVASRLQSAGYYPWSFAAENVYRGPTPIGADAILDAWAGSPPHLESLLSAQATEIGVGCYVYGDDRWCVQDFGAR